MKITDVIIGQGTNLNALQMSVRAIIVFMVSLVLIRISGRRSFGMRTPYDNIIIILLGSVLARSVSGASPFGATLTASLILVLLHRLTGFLVLRSDTTAGIVEGHKILLYKNGTFFEKNLTRALVRHEDIMCSLRKITQSERLDMVENIYMEASGEITIKLKNENIK